MVVVLEDSTTEEKDAAGDNGGITEERLSTGERALECTVYVLRDSNAGREVRYMCVPYVNDLNN